MDITTFLKNSFIVVMILVGFILLARFLPNVFDQDVDIFMKKISVYIVFIFITFFCLMMYLRSRNVREGFQDEDYNPFTDWKSLQEEYMLTELCKTYDDVFSQIFQVEKTATRTVGPDGEARITPSQLTDEQAKEKTKKYFTNISPLATFPCDLYKKVNEASEKKDIDTLYEALDKLPDDFLPTAYETASALRVLLQKQEQDAQNIINGGTPTVEGFQTRQSRKPCSPEVAVERRKFLREQRLDQAAQQCFLPEEMPVDEKKDMSRQKMENLRLAFSAYVNSTLNELQADFDQTPSTNQAAMSLMNNKSIKDILNEVKVIKEKLDVINKKADSGELLQEFKLPPVE